MSAAENLKSWRVARGFSQSWCAEQVGVRQNSWSDWEAGKKTPHVRHILKIEAITDGAVCCRHWAALPSNDSGSGEHTLDAAAIRIASGE